MVKDGRGQLALPFTGARAKPEMVAAWRGRLLGALKWAGPQAVISHRSAAALHQLDLETDLVELTIPANQRAIHPDVVVHRASVPSGAIMTVDGVRCTSIDRTLFDLGAVAEADDLAIAVECAWRRDAGFLERFVPRLKSRQTQGTPGIAQLWRVIEDCEARKVSLRSPLEVRFWWMVRRRRLPRPIPDFEVLDDEGQLTIDFAYRKQMVAVETLGFFIRNNWAKFQAEANRTARLAALGWRLLPVTYDDLIRDEETVVKRVRASLKTRFRKDPGLGEWDRLILPHGKLPPNR